MAEYYIAQNLADELIQIETTDVMTGDRNQSRFLYFQLKRSIRQAKKIDIIVSFLMESGVRMILDDLKAALDRGTVIRLLTGNYLGITQPSALYLIKKELGNQIDLRFYNQKGRSFHPKAYIFHYENGSEIYIGSSNVSKSALTSGIEWNYRFSSQKDKGNFDLFYGASERRGADYEDYDEPAACDYYYSCGTQSDAGGRHGRTEVLSASGFREDGGSRNMGNDNGRYESGIFYFEPWNRCDGNFRQLY